MSLQNQQAALGPHPAASVAVFLDLGVSTSDIARYFGVRQEELPVELLPDQSAGARSGFQMEFEFEGETPGKERLACARSARTPAQRQLRDH